MGDNASLVQALKKAGQTIATCESLTAGLLAATIAEVPGASAVLRGGLITYATELKHELAGVPAEVLEAVGPVSPECAEAMALGARRACAADWAVSLTGVAGPDPQDGHPVGEVWCGIASAEGVRSNRLGAAGLLAGDRDEIRRESVREAICLLVAAIEASGTKRAGESLG